MKNYKEMSDFEINKAVFFLSGIDYEDVIVSPQKVTGSSIQYGDGANWYEFDPCNNPSDAWPIIVKNNIAIEPEATAFIDKPTGNWIATDFNIHFQHKDKNPLRSVMVVFLMMKEKEQETK